MKRVPALIRLDPPDLWRFSVASRSEWGRRYVVLVEFQQPDDPILCDCPRFTKNQHHYGGLCHHVKAVLKYLKRLATKDPEPSCDSPGPVPP